MIQGATLDQCWAWRGSRDRKGYGRLGIEGKKVELIHRFSWQLHFGAIPDGQCVLHSCDNPPCANPRHLFLGTRADNNVDMREKGRDSHAGLFSAERFAQHGHPRTKITQEEVELIQSLYAPRRTTRKELAERFGISESSVKSILSGRHPLTGPARVW